MPTDQTVHHARKNGSGGGQFVPPGGVPTTVGEVIDLLVSASEGGHTGVRRAAKALLHAMEDYGPWLITAARHTGGTGSGLYAPDENAHITVRVGGKSYHLQVTVDGHLRRITGDANAELVPPWLPPGAPVPVGRR